MARAAKKPEPEAVKGIGAMADEIYAKKAEVAAAEAAVKALQDECRDLENALMARMESEGTQQVRGKSALITISESVRPQLNDPEAFYSFVVKRKAPYLLERRIALNAWKDMVDTLGGPVPGVGEFKSQKLSVRKA